MNSAIRRVARAGLLSAFLFIPAFSGFAAEEPAAPAQEEKIVFLKLRREGTQVRLLESSIRPGHLKPQPKRGALEFEVAAGDGSTLQAGAVKDPAVERLEYEDPAHPGQIIARPLERPNAEFTVRIPYRAAARTVRFYLKPTPAPGKSAAAVERIPFGEIRLPVEVAP